MSTVLVTTSDRVLQRSRRKALWVIGAVIVFVTASFWSLNLKWGEFLAPDALANMARFIAGFFPPETLSAFLARTWDALLETLAMSALGTLLAAVGGLAFALPASKASPDDPARFKPFARFLLNALRSIPNWCGRRCC